MADEAEVAIRTEQIATALSKARTTLESVALATSQTGLDRVLERRLDDVESLRTGAGWVRENEAEARAVNNNPESEDVQRFRAEESVRGAFRGVQHTAGVLVERINGTREELGELSDQLAYASHELDRGIDQLDKLEQLPGRRTADTELMRSRLQNLQGAVGVASESLGRATARLESARDAAWKLETSALEVDGSGQHSLLVDRTSSQLETDLSVAREGLTGLSGQLTIAEPGANEATSQSIKMAIESERLAREVQAGLNPQPTDPRQASSMGEQDRRHGTSGPSRGKDLNL
ncbi:hypothetical protein ACIBL3_16380 [Kribbella sp. NPDC050124]|uniref:hypothetical protein n=1 Tax=Kribbella sp. NPDC050124 TaxID=3364114 RepID=UPI0037B36CF6